MGSRSPRARNHSEGDRPTSTLQAQAEAIAAAYTPPAIGRPSDIGDAPTVQKFLHAIEAGHYLETAAKFAGLSKVTVYDWIKRGEAGEEPHAAFLNALKKAEANAECEALDNVRQAGKLPQFWAASMTLLERRYPERWGRRQEDTGSPRVTVVNVQGGVQVQLYTPSPSPVIDCVPSSPLELIQGEAVKP